MCQKKIYMNPLINLILLKPNNRNSLIKLVKSPNQVNTFPESQTLKYINPFT